MQLILRPCNHYQNSSLVFTIFFLQIWNVIFNWNFNSEKLIIARKINHYQHYSNWKEFISIDDEDL